MRKVRRRGRLVVAVFALAIVPLAVTGVAMALTPSLGVLTDANTTTTVKFDDGPFKMKIREPIRVRNAHVGVAAGLETVWHTHPGPEIISVKEGTLNIFVARTRRGDDEDDDDDDEGGSSRGDCETIVLTAGQAYIGSPNVPFRLTASGAVEFTVAHLLEIGAPFQTNVPAPTC